MNKESGTERRGEGGHWTASMTARCYGVTNEKMMVIMGGEASIC